MSRCVEMDVNSSKLKTGDGRALPVHLKAQICRELARLELLIEQIKAVEAERDEMSPRNKSPRLNRRRRCCSPSKASVRSSPPCSGRKGLFRHFDNRRQVAAYAGLAPTPWQSGSVDREQGVSKAGNPRLRTTLIQLAWLWLRHQPQSALALWFEERVRHNGGRFQETTIVALARKLLVALWKYVTAGVVIEGAAMKAVLVNDRRIPNNPQIFQDPISSGGSGWTNRFKTLARKTVFRDGLVFLSPYRRKRDIGAAVSSGDRM